MHAVLHLFVLVGEDDFGAKVEIVVVMNDEYDQAVRVADALHTFGRWQRDVVLKPKQSKYAAMADDERELLAWYPNYLRDLEQCIEINQAFTREVAQAMAEDWGLPTNSEEWLGATAEDYDKVRATLLQLGREWSSNGDAERRHTYGPLLQKAEELFPPEARRDTKVLVPGCGLGRLVYEFVKAGFWTQGNEVSHPMLAVLSYMLNRAPASCASTIFPYIHLMLHLEKRLHLVMPVHIPDESAVAYFTAREHRAQADLMLMAVGSFVDLYGPPGLRHDAGHSSDPTAALFRRENAASFSLVATAFFVDTAHNVIDYIKAVRHVLRPGGVWLNVGPLHWHFEGDALAHTLHMPDGHGAPRQVHTVMEGMELSRSEVHGLVRALGFDLEVSDAGQTTYSSNPQARLAFYYGCGTWVATKR